MPATAPRIIRIHEAEVATDGESMLDYAAAIALLVLLVVLLAATWAAATPHEGADLTVPAPPAAETAQVLRAPDGTAYQPLPEGPQQVTASPATASS